MWGIPLFESFDITIPTSSAEEAADFYRLLPMHISHRSLKVLSVSLNLDSPISHSGRLLEPVFCFTNLVFISISTPAGFDLDDATALDIARAWPTLQGFTLKASHPECAPRATLFSLLAFAQNCPHLRTLSMSLDALMVPQIIFPAGQDVDSTQCGLVSHGVPQSPVCDAVLLANFISAIFSVVKQVMARTMNTSMTDDELHIAIGHCQIWNQVNTIIRLRGHVGALYSAR
ncbi:hypothetical protein FB451DRAFT_1454794 [Mycena latifolia]|nr:hypothetical protein FB451DRAFT_1454794 [Mycena latifolia]